MSCLLQAVEKRFLRRICGMTLLNSVKSADIREIPSIKSLLLRLERSQLLWNGHVTQMSKVGNQNRNLQTRF